jgi:hypothetical protein
MSSLRSILFRRLGGFESGVAGVLLLLLSWAFLDRMREVAANVDRQGLLTTYQDLTSQLLIYQSLKRIEGRLQDLRPLLHQNPVGVVFSAPAGYIGPITPEEEAAVPAGSWYFLTGAGQLIYRVRDPGGRIWAEGGRERIRLRLVAIVDDPRGGDIVLRLTALDPF